ncbi:MAG TPA: type II toxin-antitoxin system VapC family toxin [Xanthobacteraceae bacterium]|nr:type II toxin-antitoxin system VapC family toxin [Xanthobacteraceae bacterium]
MILVDTSVWAQHFRREVAALSALLEAGEVLAHPFVLGELALGNLRHRDSVLTDYRLLPQARSAAHEEVLELVERTRLFGRGIGYVDAHLLAATALSEDARLWTFDRKLAAIAVQLNLSYRPA